MSDLEKFIMENRENMNLDEPNRGHFRRFRKKLNAPDDKIRRINFRHALQIAASVAVILTSGILIVKSSKGGSKVAATPVVEEFQETTNYYARQVNDRYEDISTLDFSSEDEKEILLEELSQMDSYYQDLLKEFDANPGDERVMNALIQHYQMKLEVLDQIINQLKQLKNSNTQQNENTSI